MLINNNGISTNSNHTRQKGVDQVETHTAGRTTPASSKDRVELSDQAQQLAHLETQIALSPDVDTQRVDAIRNAIANGSYTIDAEAIAEKILASDAF
ncbi:MAG: flagellar biosynthesis anti-sigma factor FlgM [Cellvibrionaceae bacterium]|nr:flagellar biosynthesis anti-sigma factor FlgM [Cellvibrionaceae bacterium]